MTKLSESEKTFVPHNTGNGVNCVPSDKTSVRVSWNDSEVLVKKKKEALTIKFKEFDVAGGMEKEVDVGKSKVAGDEEEIKLNHPRDKRIIDDFSNLLQDLLRCSICSELFVRATTLQCGHTFCEICILKWILRRPKFAHARFSGFSCPYCRKNCTELENSNPCINNLVQTFVNFSLNEEQQQNREKLVNEREIMGTIYNPFQRFLKRLDPRLCVYAFDEDDDDDDDDDNLGDTEDEEDYDDDLDEDESDDYDEE